MSSSDPILPSLLLSPIAVQEFIALQSAEIARLRADVKHLKAQNADPLTLGHEYGGDGTSHRISDKISMSEIKEHINTALQARPAEFVAGLKDGLANCEANHRGTISTNIMVLDSQPQDNLVITAVREEVTQCKSGWRDLTAELASTKRALQGFRLPELVLTSRWETGPHPLERDDVSDNSARSHVEAQSQEHSRSSTPKTPALSDKLLDSDSEAATELHIKVDEAQTEGQNVSEVPNDNSIEREPEEPISPPDGHQTAAQAYSDAGGTSARSASAASAGFVEVSLPGPEPEFEADSDWEGDSGLGTPPESPMMRLSPLAKKSPFTAAATQGGRLGRKWTLDDLYKPLPEIDAFELTRSIRDKLINEW
ncbi:hypothetical protein C8Q72DRAFT_910890 [Fomitopsis betulina]|nr:hypothetical protein C8Q72DRAFT_910890 [Fomitopsis betulina]